MDKEFESLVVTDPDIVDEGIDISGLKTQTDVSPFLLGNIPDFAGIQYEAFNPNRLSDLMRLYSSGLPARDTAQIPGAVDTLVDVGGGMDQVTGGSVLDTPTAQIPGAVDTLINVGGGADMGTVPATTPVTQPVTGGITGDTIDVGIPDSETDFVDYLVTQGGAPVVSQQLQDKGPTTVQGELSQVTDIPGVTQADLTQAAIDKERLELDYIPSFDTSGLTDATPEQRNTIQNILAAAGDNVQGALTELGKIPGAVVDFANQTVDFLGKKLDVGKTLASIAINKAVGGPISLIFSVLPQDSLENRTKRSIVSELTSEKNYGFDEGNKSIGQDPFGRNPVSQFGDYEKTLTEDINNPSDTRMGKAKKEFAQDYFDRKAEKAGGVEVDEGTILGSGEAPGDLITLEELQAQKDAEIAAQNELAKLTGNVDTFDTTPATDVTSDLVDEVALTGGPSETGVNPFADIDTGVGEFDTTPVETTPNKIVTETKPVDTRLADDRAVDELSYDQIIEYENLTNKLEGEEIQKTGNPDITLSKQEEIKNKAIDKIKEGDSDPGPVSTATGVNPFADIDTGVGEFDTTPVDEFSDEEFMVGDTSTAAPAGGDSGVDRFFDATDRKVTGTTKPGTGGGADSGGSSGGGKSIVCTAMYQTTGLKDWSKAMKIWYIYQKKYLTIQHQNGYHKLFKPFVKGMHKNNLIKMIGAHVAKHRTQHLKHVMFNSKPSLLGKIYNKILEPICYWVGKNG